MTTDINRQLAIAELKKVLPENSWSEDSDIIAPHLKEWRDRWTGHTPLLLLPRNTQEVSLAVKACKQYGLGITTQGGNTGLVGGQIPQGEMLLSTKNLTQIREQDEFSLTVEAGCILQSIQELANTKNRLFPLSLASQGSASIGGLCSTNAGGVHVIRYGSMRDLVLGLEVVLADGSILNSLKPLKKDNTGYHMTPLFLGAEGTLGIITAVQLKLFAKPTQQETVFIALDTIDKALDLLSLTKKQIPNELAQIELISEIALDFVTSHIPNCSSPFTETSPWYVLLQFETSGKQSLRQEVESLIEALLNKNTIKDAVLAQSLQQAHNLMKLRENISEAQKPEGGSIKHDISVPIECIPQFIQQASLAVQTLIPNCRPVPFGHLGDGNIHFNVSQPVDMNKDEYLSHWEAMNRLVHDIVIELGGSISAEHGIGVLKKQELAERGDAVKLASMRSIKLALDPDNILNPRIMF